MINGVVLESIEDGLGVVEFDRRKAIIGHHTNDSLYHFMDCFNMWNNISGKYDLCLPAVGDNLIG